LATEKLKNHKSSGIDQIPAELIKAGGRTIIITTLNQNHLLSFIWLNNVKFVVRRN